jgi:hypothetical protein
MKKLSSWQIYDFFYRTAILRRKLRSFVVSPRTWVRTDQNRSLPRRECQNIAACCHRFSTGSTQWLADRSYLSQEMDTFGKRGIVASGRKVFARKSTSSRRGIRKAAGDLLKQPNPDLSGLFMSSEMDAFVRLKNA